jgi:membrane-bound serine protease (ClpP class)
MILRLLVLAFLAVAVLSSVPAAAQVDDDETVVVAEVAGPLDQRTLDYLEEAVREDVQLVILQIDAPGIASGDPSGLYSAIVETPTPIGMWVGPDGAQAFGGAGFLVPFVDVVGAAPGAEMGLLTPLVADGSGPSAEDAVDEIDRGVEPDALSQPLPPFDAVAEVTEDGLEVVTEVDGVSQRSGIPGVLDVISPSIGQFIAALDGQTVAGRALETTETITADDGTEIIVPSVFVEFRKPGLFTRFLRLSIQPEATFFFLVAGIALAAFEFYAAGAGISAAVSVLSFFLAAYGLATLPINWLAVAAVLLGMAMYTWEFQLNQLGIRSILGSILLVVGGLTLTTAEPQFGPQWWAVLLVVAGVAAFYVFAMGTVVRSRFSTPTIGREHLIGARGIAETDFDPEGTVTIDGAQWRARSHRAAGLQPGDEIEVLEVSGTMLEVGPPAPAS